MIRLHHCAALMVALAVAGGPAAHALGEPGRASMLSPGRGFCPSRIIVVGAVALGRDRCFSVFLMRTAEATFFAFAPADTLATTLSQVVLIRTPRGAAIARRVFLALPIVVTGTPVPIGTLRLVPFLVEETGTALIIRLAEDPTTTATVVPARSPSGALVPDDARIIPPGPGVPRDDAAFSGKWMGQWDGRWNGLPEGSLPHILFVEEIDRDDGFLTSTTRAVVLSSWGSVLSWDVFPGWYRGRGVFERGVLRVALPGGGLATYRMSIDGTLDATYAGPDFGVLQATMKRMRE